MMAVKNPVHAGCRKRGDLHSRIIGFANKSGS